MLVILSPAKTLDFSPAPAAAPKATQPAFAQGADYLAGELRKLAPAKLKALLGVSDALAKLNHERFQAWGSQDQKPCVLAYLGDAYRSLQAAELPAEDLVYAQDHVRILSGLYGVLRPLDAIQPYRLEMGSRLANTAGKDLYVYWRDKVTASLREDLQQAPKGEQFLEYAKAVDLKALGFPVYQMSFPGPSLFAKGARGAMVRYLIVNKVTSPEELKKFTGNDGEWAFQASQSSETEFVFARTAPKKAAAKAGNTGRGAKKEVKKEADGKPEAKPAAKKRRKA